MSIKATKIKMRNGCQHSYNLLEIDQIYLEGVQTDGYYAKENVHDFIKAGNGPVYVNIDPYPVLEHAVSVHGEKYVRSKSNATERDNLLNLPRE